MLDTGAYPVLALAAVGECIAAVDATAYGRTRVDDRTLTAIVRPLFERSPNDLAAVFPTPRDFESGLRETMTLLRGEHPRQAELTRYLLGVLDLTARLERHPTMAADLGARLDDLEQLATNQQIEALASLYAQTIGTLGRRIQVIGDPASLQRDATAATIRTLLLSAIRFAWLWKQLGGRRWHLILRRKALLVALQDLEDRL